MINILIITPNNGLILNTERNATLDRFKKDIEKATGVPADRQRLTFDGREIDGCSTLVAATVRNGDMVHVDVADIAENTGGGGGEGIGADIVGKAGIWIRDGERDGDGDWGVADIKDEVGSECPPPVPPPPLTTRLHPGQGTANCKMCRKAGRSFRRCSGCYLVYYCSPACQQANWESHYVMCKMLSKTDPDA